MTLAISVCPRDTVTLPGGGTQEIRGLSRAEAIQIRGLIEDVTTLEIRCIQYATGETEEVATAWHNSARNDDVEFLIDAIARLSGLAIEDGKKDGEGLPSEISTE